MQTINIDGQEIKYYKKEEISKANIGNKVFYLETYKIAESICKKLNIQCPDIHFEQVIRCKDEFGRMSVEGAMLFTPMDVPSLHENLIIMSLEKYNYVQFLGTLAHELRHIWQNTYHPNMNQKPAKGFGESLTHPAEIDADGFAIWYLSEAPNMYLQKAAGIMCPEEKKHYPKAYTARVEKAKEIKAYFDEQRKKRMLEKNSPSKPKKLSFLEKLIHIITKKGGSNYGK